jgi:restriction system protein
MSIPKYDDIYKEILITVSDGDEHDIDSIRDSVAKQKGVTADERAILLDSGSKPVFDDRVGWARIYLMRLDLLIISGAGFTQIPDKGKNVLTTNIAVIDNAFLRQYDSFRYFQSRTKSNVTRTTETVINCTQENMTPAERMETAFAEINSSNYES